MPDPRMPPDSPYYPIVSGHRQRFTLRFMAIPTSTDADAANEDITFEFCRRDSKGTLYDCMDSSAVGPEDRRWRQSRDALPFHRSESPRERSGLRARDRGLHLRQPV